ncbi:hypothetical protein F5B21DRAFT_481660 [Xylaria acuta]|nr:hypothetical protein F5B21DRAFT_481660 [Xylaria acuta]
MIPPLRPRHPSESHFPHNLTERRHDTDTNAETNTDALARRRRKCKREMPLRKSIVRKKIDTLPHPLPRPHPPWRGEGRLYKPDKQVWAGELILHRLNATQFDTMMSIFTRLSSIRGLAGVTPHLTYDRSRLEIYLEYPGRKVSRVANGLYSVKRSDVAFRVQDIRQLRDILLHDIGILCTSRIALSHDICFLNVIRRRGPQLAYVPVLDTFDLDLCAEQHRNTTDWKQIERDIVQKVETQFQTFEFLIQVDLPRPLAKQLPLRSDVELDPENAHRILQAKPPSSSMWHLVVLQVNRYSPALARYTIDLIESFVASQRKRSRMPNDNSRWRYAGFSDTIRHMLRLSSTDEVEGVEQNMRLLSDRAVMCVLNAIILVHNYAKVIPVEHEFSRCLLQLDNPGPANAYNCYKGFDLVAEAYCEAQTAIQILNDAGGFLKETVKRFIRGRLDQEQIIST